MKRKIYTSLFFILFFGIFSSIFWWEYFDFYEQKNKIKIIEQENQEYLDQFSLDKITWLEHIDFFHTPDKQVLNTIIDKIDSAQKTVYIEVYIFTENRTKQALLRAKKRGVDVKVIMEKNPYMAYNINNKTQDFLEKHNINYQWSDSQDYALNHAKFYLIDDLAIISTGNLSYSTFTRNRDLFIFSEDKSLLHSLYTIFEKDYTWEKYQVYHPQLILSPFSTRKKFETLFQSATGSIAMYFQYFKDEELINLLSQKAQQWIEIQAIISKTAYKSNQTEIETLVQNGINIQVLKKYNMHSKAILIDNTFLYIGSINFSDYSIDKNREVWIITKKPQIIQEFLSLYHKEKTIPIHQLK